MWKENQFIEPFVYQPIPPCFKVLGNSPIASFPLGVRQEFPDNFWLRNWELESYIGIPLFDPSGRLLGLMSVMDTRPMDNPELVSAILQVFATYAAGEPADHD